MRDRRCERRNEPPYLEVYEKCKSGGENEAVLKTLENVIVLLTQTLQQLNATPAVRLVDSLMTMDPTAQGNEVRDTMKQAFDSGDVKPEDLEASLTMMIDSMSEQDEAWEVHVAQAVETTSKEEFEQLVAHASGRMEAKRRLTQLRTMCGGGDATENV